MFSETICRTHFRVAQAFSEAYMNLVMMLTPEINYFYSSSATNMWFLRSWLVCRGQNNGSCLVRQSTHSRKCLSSVRLFSWSCVARRVHGQNKDTLQRRCPTFAHDATRHDLYDGVLWGPQKVYESPKYEYPLSINIRIAMWIFICQMAQCAWKQSGRITAKVLDCTRMAVYMIFMMYFMCTIASVWDAQG